MFIIKTICEKRHLWTFQKFVKRLTQIIEKKLASFRVSLANVWKKICHHKKIRWQNPDFWDDNIAAQKTSQTEWTQTNCRNFPSDDWAFDESKSLAFSGRRWVSSRRFTWKKSWLNSKMMTSYEMTLLLSRHDNNNAILEIHPGSGGTGSPRLGRILTCCVCHTRFGNAKGFQSRGLGLSRAGDEAGIKSVTLSFEGPRLWSA